MLGRRPHSSPCVLLLLPARPVCLIGNQGEWASVLIGVLSSAGPFQTADDGSRNGFQLENLAE